MPHIDGVYHPTPFKPLRGSLFDVLPPDHPEEEVPPTAEDHEWYEELVAATAELLVFVVQQMHRNFTRCQGVAFSPATVQQMHMIADKAARLLEDELGRSEVAKGVNRMAKQIGLVVYNTRPGRRFNWPMASRRISHEEAKALVRDAFWGRWPAELPPTVNGRQVPRGR